MKKDSSPQSRSGQPGACGAAVQEKARGVEGLPEAAWCRIIVLAVGLAAGKLALLWELRKPLFEIHWRVTPEYETWLNNVAFGGFVLLGVVALWQLASGCERIGLKAMRSANAVVISLGLLFILLCFHNGEFNYLYPVMTGVLELGDLKPYLNLDFFFQQPFLAAWLGGYALLYYVLTRSGRERWMSYITALAAGAYGLLYLRELSIKGEELLLVDCLGLVAVFAAGSRARKVGWSWTLGPIAWGVFFWYLFVPFDKGLQQPNPYLVMLMGSVAVLFAGGSLLIGYQGALRCWSPYLMFFAAGFLLLSNSNYPGAGNYSNLLFISLEMPRYFAGELGLVAGVLAMAFIGARYWPRGSWWWLDVLSVAALGVMLIDFKLTQIMGVRLDWSVLRFADSPRMMWRMAGPYLPWVGLAGAGVSVLYGLGVYGGRYLLQKRRAKGGVGVPERWSAAAVLLGGSFLSLALLGVWRVPADKALGAAAMKLASPAGLWRAKTEARLGREEFLHRARELGIGRFDLAGGTRPTERARPLNVLLVFMESSYNQHLSLFGSSEETQPLLASYRERMELYPNFFSSFAGSINARFAAFTSLYPARDFNAFTTHRVPVLSIFELLHEQGYACSLFYSSFLDYTAFRDFLSDRGLEAVYDADTMPGKRKTGPISWGLREEETMGAICEQIQKYAAKKERFFLTYVPAAPHYPYDSVPARFHQFKSQTVGDFTPLYLNELLYMDWVISSIVQELERTGVLDSTLVIISNDHGEMLGANGGPIGHCWRLTPELANTPLIILDPGRRGYRVNPEVGSQVDLLPTIMDRLHLALPAGQLYEGHSLDGQEGAESHRIYLNTFMEYGIWTGQRLYLGDRQKSGSPEGLKAFQIQNQGSKTVFCADAEAPAISVSMPEFDAFQENLLQNYSYYSRLVLAP